MPKHLYRALLWSAVIGMMALIFAFSAQPAEESDQLTKIPAEPVTDAVSSLMGEMDDSEALALYNVVAGVIRKMAHFFEYALLGMMILLLCRSYGYNWWLLPVMIGTLYAASDEIHQLFIPNRFGTVTDVLLDTIGLICGVRFLLYIINHRRNQHVHDQ